MLTWLGAILIVGTGCLLLSLAGTAAFLWAWRAVQRSRVVGIAGVVFTLAAAVNLAVPRVCDEAPTPERNRPGISAFFGDGTCQRHGLAQVQVVILLALGTSLAVHEIDRRRHGTKAEDSARH